MTAQKYLKNAYAVLLAAACIAGGAGAFYLAFASGNESAAILCVCGMLASVFFAPFLHEAGHTVFAKANGFTVLYVKIFIFRSDNTGEKKRFSLCSPFAAEQTQAAPEYAEKRPGEMKKRAALYTAGGLVFGGVYLCVAAVLSAAFAGKGGTADGVSYFCLGALPYAAYLFFLNVVPFTYGGGKTDMRVLIDILKQTPCGVRFIAALNAQGQIAEGKAYSEIDETYLRNLPAIAEDEPLFIMNLFYLYYAAAEKGEAEAAAAYINRIASLAPYLTPQEEKTALCELLYMNAVSGDEEQAQKCYSAFCSYGETGTAAENRAAAAYYVLRGDAARADEYIGRAVSAAEKEKFSGARKSEELLLRQITGG
ncbi:MAG: hypothetical protein ACI4RO_01955 [Candidatus Scatosoma sp.]